MYIPLAGCNWLKKSRFDNRLSSAIELKDRKMYEEALDKIDEAIKIDPDEAPAYIVKGQINDALNKYSAAILDLSKAIDIEPTNILALYQKGLTHAMKGEYDSAIEFYNKAIRQKGTDTLYFELNNNNQLNAEIIKSDVDMTIIRYCRGFAFYMTKNDDKALNDFDFCLSNGYENNGSVFLYSGIIYISQGFSDKGCARLKLALRNGNSAAEEYITKYCK